MTMLMPDQEQDAAAGEGDGNCNDPGGVAVFDDPEQLESAVSEL